MRVAPVLLAFLALSSGCAALGGQATPTVTPVPVPDDATPTEATASTPTAGPDTEGACAVPRAPDGGGSGSAPETVSRDAYLFENGSVNTSALVRIHQSALVEQRFHLTAPRFEVYALPNLSAFRYRGETRYQLIQWYAVNGTLYLHESSRNGATISNFTYHQDELSTFFAPWATGASLIESATAPYEYRVRGLTVRNRTVLTAIEAANETGGRTELPGGRRVTSVSSRLLVDMRGVVVHFRHVVRWERPTGETGVRRVTVTVSDLEGPLEPPSVFC